MYTVIHHGIIPTTLCTNQASSRQTDSALLPYGQIQDIFPTSCDISVQCKHTCPEQNHLCCHFCSWFFIYLFTALSKQDFTYYINCCSKYEKNSPKSYITFLLSSYLLVASVILHTVGLSVYGEWFNTDGWTVILLVASVLFEFISNFSQCSACWCFEKHPVCRAPREEIRVSKGDFSCLPADKVNEQNQIMAVILMQK